MKIAGTNIGAKKRGSAFLRGIIFDNWLLKLVSLVIAFFLWLGITGLNNDSTTKLSEIPLKTTLSRDLSNQVYVEVGRNLTVELQITGEKTAVESINPRNLIVNVDLSQVQPGEKELELSVSNVRVSLPVGARLESISPNRIPISVERIISKRVEVEPVFERNLRPGVTEIEPAQVQISGPESKVKDLKTIRTRPLEVESEDSLEFEKNVELDLVPGSLKANPASVTVRFRPSNRK